MRLPRLTQVLAQLSHAATARTFGVPDEDRREMIRHGYLLALEDVEREMRLREPRQERVA